MLRFVRRFVILAVACLLGCGGLAQAESSTATQHAGARLTALADAYLAALTKAFPEFATSEDLPGADHGALTDNTESGLARWQAYEEAALAELFS